jgi:hypothetical protein
MANLSFTWSGWLRGSDRQILITHQAAAILECGLFKFVPCNQVFLSTLFIFLGLEFSDCL